MSNTEEDGPQTQRTGIPRDLPDQEAREPARRSSDRERPEQRRAGAAPEEDVTDAPEPEEPTD